jgi:zinc protease
VPARARPQEPVHHAPRRVVLESAQVRQPSWRKQYLAPSYGAGEKEHAYALQLLAEVLGGGATSRLNKALVMDQTIAISASAWYDPHAVDLGLFGLSASPKQGTDMAVLEAAVMKTVAEVLADGIKEDEVARAKQRLRDSAVLARDSQTAGARVLGAALAVGRGVEDVESWPERITAVTVEQMNAAARAVFKENQSVTGLLLPKPTS